MRSDFFNCTLSRNLGLDGSVPLSERLPRRYEKDDHDVFALVKHHMADDDLCQPALLVAPGQERRRVLQFWKDAVSHRGELSNIDPDRSADLLELSDALARYPQYQRAVQYLRGLAGAEPRPRLPVQPLGFLATGGQVSQGLVCALPERAPRPLPHNLRVRFHRP